MSTLRPSDFPSNQPVPDPPATPGQQTPDPQDHRPDSQAPRDVPLANSGHTFEDREVGSHDSTWATPDQPWMGTERGPDGTGKDPSQGLATGGPAETSRVDAANQKVADAKVALDAAVVEHDTAVADRDRAVADAAPQPIIGQHIFIQNDGGSLSMQDVPKGLGPLGHMTPKLNIGGVNYEHVHDHASGAWVYRRM
jgi:hypothetical protein